MAKQVPKGRSVLAGEIASSKALTINVDGQGYVGARQGGGVKLKYEF